MFEKLATATATAVLLGAAVLAVYTWHILIG